MLIREKLELEEKKRLSNFAQLSTDTLGRDIREEECPVRTAFQRDKDRILHSKSFRLLKQKTQVFLSTTGEEFRTRLTHVLEVAQVARTICRALKLNEDLAEAIALGHDLGHTPFGHKGEEILDNICPEGFHHSNQSLRIVEKLEKDGQGLNLTREVRDGILNHSKGHMSLVDFWVQPADKDIGTLEGRVTQCSDWIAYICHDIDDALDMRLIEKSDIPSSASRILGMRHSSRMNSMICDLIEHSEGGVIGMGKEVMGATEELRGFLYDKVYSKPAIRDKDEHVRSVIETLYRYYIKNKELVIEHMPWLEGVSSDRAVADYLSLLTDRKAEEEYLSVKTKITDAVL